MNMNANTLRFAGTPLAVLLLAASVASAAPAIDNVLIRMVPPGTTSLVGAHMDQLMASDLFRKLAAQQKLPQLDQFARDTGFDPRRDVREILAINGPQGGVLLARGTFNLKQEPAAGMKLVRHGQYEIHTAAGTGTVSGYCILDSSLAVAGELTAIEAALDEWQNGAHNSLKPLLAPVASLDPQITIWGVSTGFASFLAANLPHSASGVDLSAIFKGIESTWFSAAVASGLQATIHCTTATEKDAMNLRDTTKGLIGFGRLSVPQNKPDLLRFWDGFSVDQSGTSFALNADIPGDLLDEMVQMLSTAGGGRAGRGASGRGGRGGRGASGRGGRAN